MTQKNFETGQEVWIKGGGKYDTELVKAVVSKVGRKYVTAGGKRYDIHSHQEIKDVGEEGYLYLSEQEYLDEIELDDNKGKIRSYFDRWSKKDITIEQTREILAILEGGSTK